MGYSPWDRKELGRDLVTKQNNHKEKEKLPGLPTVFHIDAIKSVSRVLCFAAIYLDAALPLRSSRLLGTTGPVYVSLHGVAPDRVYSTIPSPDDG